MRSRVLGEDLLQSAMPVTESEQKLLVIEMSCHVIFRMGDPENMVAAGIGEVLGKLVGATPVGSLGSAAQNHSTQAERLNAQALVITLPPVEALAVRNRIHAAVPSGGIA